MKFDRLALKFLVWIAVLVLVFLALAALTVGLPSDAAARWRS